MTNECWNFQKARLIDRFGERNFSKEFSLLVAIECRPMSDQSFVELVNLMIGSRPANRPPLVVDFREGRLFHEKRKLERDSFGAMRAMDNPNLNQGLRPYLAKEFPGCKTLNEAVEVRKHQIRIQKADNPKYDPMCDAKWMGEHAWDPNDGGDAA